jgi:site-specific DNA recombinase
MEFPHEPETGVVRRIFDLCLNGYGMRNILRQLDELGYKARNGKRFRKGLVESILKNEVYTWTLKFADIRVENAHSPIIDPDTFQRAQEMLLEREPQKGGAGYTASPYGFSGLLYCSKCGEKLIAEKVFRGERVYTYYVCSGQKNKKNLCAGVRHRKAFLDYFLKEKIIEKILSEEHYPLIHTKIESFLKKLKRNTPRRVGNLNRDLAGVRSKIDNLLEAIGQRVIDPYRDLPVFYLKS